MKLRKVCQSAALILAISLGHTTVAFAAPNYSDVPQNHWAYQAISNLADQGIMVGNSSNQYYPNLQLDKFYTAKVLAKAAGYRVVDLTTDEQNYINNAYNANKTLLSNYKNTYPSLWDSTADREIAYLLEKQILVSSDLDTFVVKYSDGSEKLRALTREEICVYLVRLAGLESEALSTAYTGSLFSDDSSISANCKPYVYFLYSKQIVSGTNSTTFDPKGIVNKATLAVLLNKTMNAYTTTDISSGQTNSANANTIQVKTITGVIQDTFPALNAVQVTDYNSGSTMYLTKNDASQFYLGGFVTSYSALEKGMTFTAVLTDNTIVELRAQAASSGQTNNTNTTAPQTNTTVTQNNITTAGTVGEINLAANSIEILVTVLSPRGDTLTENRIYQVNSNTAVKRGDDAITLSGIQSGEVVTAVVNGSSAISLVLEPQHSELRGTLIEKSQTEAGNPVLSIEGLHETREFRITANTTITRMGIGNIGWQELRIGDSIEIIAEYGNAVDIYATGTSSTIQGVVEDIYIANGTNKVTLRDTNNISKTYNVISRTADMYLLRIGANIKATLDSQEIDTFTVLDTASTANSRTGSITYVTGDYFYMTDSNSSSAYNEVKVFYNSSTRIIDAYTGKSTSSSDLYEGVQVLVVFDNNSSTSYQAKTITILSN